METGLLLEKSVWQEIFDYASEVYSKYFRDADDWETVKMHLAGKIAGVIAKYFMTVRKILMTELSGGECVEGERGSFDIDLIVEVESRAEAYALASLEPIIDNALKEAFVFTVSEEKYRRLLRKYGRGLNHNIVELHINNEYALRLAKSPFCPAIVLYERGS